MGKILAFAALAASTALAADYPIDRCGSMSVTGGFWFDRLETNRTVTLAADFAKCRETPRIANFTNAANRAWGTFGGIYFDDSDVYKVMEGAAYIQATHPDPALERYMDELVGWMARAQEVDGYLYTARVLGDGKVRRWGRWEQLEWSHELYNQGHMIEAAVAWQEATGKTNFLEVAKKSADLMCRTFGPAPTQLKSTSGHEEVELALVKLFRATGERRYLDLARFFVDMRGRGDLRRTWGAGLQDHLPVLRQDEALGHAVRAGYLYCAMADIAALLGDDPAVGGAYAAAVNRLWENVVSSKLHLNGGIGARQKSMHSKWGLSWEGFGDPYDLPNDAGDAYLETCAAIANALWCERMFRLTGESRYVDVLERTLYNGFLSGVSLSGDEFFYPNPLASKGGYGRSKWFGTSCCPVNIVRFLPQVPSLAFASKKGVVYWNLFMAGEARIGASRRSPGGFVRLEQKTDYPWGGCAELKVLPAPNGDQASRPSRFALKVRVPGWAKGRPVPSDLYSQTAPASSKDVALSLNGEAVPVEIGADGYVEIPAREWRAGDTVQLRLPMDVKRIRAHENVVADRGRLAVERGPLVYCAEGIDNGGAAYAARIPPDATFTDEAIAIGDRSFSALRASNGILLVPYCVWGNREKNGELQTWF